MRETAALRLQPAAQGAHIVARGFIALQQRHTGPGRRRLARWGNAPQQFDLFRRFGGAPQHFQLQPVAHPGRLLPWGVAAQRQKARGIAQAQGRVAEGEMAQRVGDAVGVGGQACLGKFAFLPPADQQHGFDGQRGRALRAGLGLQVAHGLPDFRPAVSLQMSDAGTFR